MPWRLQSNPSTMEKVCGGLSYFTFGLAGLIYLLLSKNSGQSQLFRFHMYQAVFLSILATLITWAIVPLVGIITNVVSAFAQPVAVGIATAAGMIQLICGGLFQLVLLYGAVMAFLGKFAEIPFISPMVRQNMRF
jgi:uncharacterized membrane protein